MISDTARAVSRGSNLDQADCDPAATLSHVSSSPLSGGMVPLEGRTTAWDTGYLSQTPRGPGPGDKHFARLPVPMLGTRRSDDLSGFRRC